MRPFVIGRQNSLDPEERPQTETSASGSLRAAAVRELGVGLR